MAKSKNNHKKLSFCDRTHSLIKVEVKLVFGYIYIYLDSNGFWFVKKMKMRRMTFFKGNELNESVILWFGCHSWIILLLY